MLRVMKSGHFNVLLTGVCDVRRRNGGTVLRPCSSQIYFCSQFPGCFPSDFNDNATCCSVLLFFGERLLSFILISSPGIRSLFLVFIKSPGTTPYLGSHLILRNRSNFPGTAHYSWSLFINSPDITHYSWFTATTHYSWFLLILRVPLIILCFY